MPYTIEKNQIKKLKIIFYGSLAFGAATAVFSIIAGADINAGYYWGLIVVIPFIILCIYSYLKQKQISLLLTLREQWGKENAKSRDYEQIAAYYNYSGASPGTSIDQQTWDDFSMAEVYAKIDATITTPGEGVLYDILRKPCFGVVELAERNRVINLLQTNSLTREKVQFLLHNLNRQKSNGITRLLWGELPPRHPFTLLFTLLAVVACLSLAGMFIWGARGIFLVFGVFGLNSYVHYRVSKGYLFEMPSITYLKSLLKVGKKMAALEVAGLDDYKKDLHSAVRASQKIIRKTRFLFSNIAVSDMDFLYEYLKVFLLLEVRSFYAALHEIEKQRDHLRHIYRTIGMLDSL